MNPPDQELLTDMGKNEIVMPIEPIEKLDHLHIRVAYAKEGINMGNGARENGGVYVYLTPVEYRNGIFSQYLLRDTLHSGCKVLAKPMGRRSVKAEDKVWNAIQGHAEDIAKMFRASQFTEAAALIVSLTSSL